MAEAKKPSFIRTSSPSCSSIQEQTHQRWRRKEDIERVSMVKIYLLAHVSLLHRLIRHESKVNVREMGPLEAKNICSSIKYLSQKSKLDPTRLPPPKIVTLIWQEMKTLTTFLGSYILCSCTEGFSVSYIWVSRLDALDLVPAHSCISRKS